MQVAKARNDKSGTSQDCLFRHVSRNRYNVCRLVVVRAHRSNDGGDTRRNSILAVLDEADRCGYRLYGRPCFHVCPVQDVRAAMPAMVGVQPSHLRSRLSDKRSNSKVTTDGDYDDDIHDEQIRNVAGMSRDTSSIVRWILL